MAYKKFREVTIDLTVEELRAFMRKLKRNYPDGREFSGSVRLGVFGDGGRVVVGGVEVFPPKDGGWNVHTLPVGQGKWGHVRIEASEVRGKTDLEFWWFEVQQEERSVEPPSFFGEFYEWLLSEIDARLVEGRTETRETDEEQEHHPPTLKPTMQRLYQQMLRCFLTGGEGCARNVEDVNRDPFTVFLGYQFKSNHYRSAILRDMVINATKEASGDLRAQNVSLRYDPVDQRKGDHISCEICEKIQKSIICIFEVSDQNPNVMMELGMALGVGRKVLLLRHQNGKEIPSDLKGLNRIEYSDNNDLRNRGATLAAEIERFVEEIGLVQIGVPTMQLTKEGDHQGVWIDVQSGEVWVDGQPISPLTSSEYSLLLLLYDNIDKICDKYKIMETVWSEDYNDEIDDPRIEKLISRLRQKIEPEPSKPRYIQTVRGRGYRLVSVP